MDLVHQPIEEQMMPKQRIEFCEEYLKDFDVVEAFKKAYPERIGTNGNVYSKAKAVLVRKDCQFYIQKRRAEFKKLICLDADRIAQELAAVAFTKITDVVDGSGEIRDLDSISVAAQKSIKKITIKEVDTKFGTNRNVTIEMHDKLKALEQTMNLLGIKNGDAEIGSKVTNNNVVNNVMINAADLSTEQLKKLANEGLTFDSPEAEKIEDPSSELFS